MRRIASPGFTLPEFAASLAALALVALVLHPVLAQARQSRPKLSAFHHDAAFTMYAADVDGGTGDFEGKPVLTDGLGATLAVYGGLAAAHAHHAAKSPLTGCRPFLKFDPTAYVVETGSMIGWHGQVDSPSETCTISAYDNNSAVVVPDWGNIPVDGGGNFWLVSGAVEQGVGTVSVETSTGAAAQKSVLVLD